MVDEFKPMLEEFMQDPEFKKEWETSEEEYTLLDFMIKARQNSKISQKELAERTGLKQGDISKLEKGKGNPTLNTLLRYAAGLGKTLKLELV